MVHYETDRLKAGIWVASQVRLCGSLMLPVYVSRKGDPDAGAILIKRMLGRGAFEVLNQARRADGSLGWARVTGAGPVAESEADACIARQVRFDPDLWVLEIEDPQRRYEPDGGLLQDHS